MGLGACDGRGGLADALGAVDQQPRRRVASAGVDLLSSCHSRFLVHVVVGCVYTFGWPAEWQVRESNPRLRGL